MALTASFVIILPAAVPAAILNNENTDQIPDGRFYILGDR